jgi:hypothetical protein
LELQRREFLAGVSCRLLDGSASAAPGEGPAPCATALERAARLAVGNIAQEGPDDVFPRPFEADALKTSPLMQQILARSIAHRVAAGHVALESRFLDRIDVPKWTGGFRSCAWMPPREASLYLTLAVLCAPLIEQSRLPSSLHVVHSYRYAPSPDGARLFSRACSYRSFIKRTQKLAGTFDQLVIGDISGFYGSISHPILRQSLLDCEIYPDLVDLVLKLLGSCDLPGGRGLPVGQQASRIFAEAVLAPIDRGLYESGVCFTRFVDDFRLFAGSETLARSQLEQLQNHLAERGLSLNPAKTKLINRAIQRVELIPSTVSGRHRRAGEYRPPNRRELASLRSEAVALGNILPDTTGAVTGRLKRLIRVCAFGGCARLTLGLPHLLAQHPEAVRYAVRALRHAAPQLSEELRCRVAAAFAEQLLDPATNCFVAIYLLELLGDPVFAQHAMVKSMLACHPAARQGLLVIRGLEALRRTGGIPANIRHAAIVAGDPAARRVVAADLMGGHAAVLADLLA